MTDELSDITLVIIVGTLLLFTLAGFITTLLVVYRRRYVAHQVELTSLHETHQREMLMAQLETQNQTLQHVAEDLHDHVGQMLAVVWLYLNRLRDETHGTPHQPVVEQLINHTATLVTDVRSLSKSLNTDTIARFGLVACLDMEIGRINRAGSASQASLQVTGRPEELGIQTEIILLRMVQEALNSALKYAPGTPVTLLMAYQSDELTITVTDQGPGFSMADAMGRPLPGSGQGLHNLRRRAALLEGTCSWEAAGVTDGVKRGTCVTIRIPRTKLTGANNGVMADESVGWR